MPTDNKWCWKHTLLRENFSKCFRAFSSTSKCFHNNNLEIATPRQKRSTRRRAKTSCSSRIGQACPSKVATRQGTQTILNRWCQQAVGWKNTLLPQGWLSLLPKGIASQSAQACLPEKMQPRSQTSEFWKWKQASSCKRARPWKVGPSRIDRDLCFHWWWDLHNASLPS